MRTRISSAHVLACLALFVALGGTGYAAVVIGPNSVGPRALKKNAVTTKKVKNRSLLARLQARPATEGGRRAGRSHRAAGRRRAARHTGPIREP